MPGACAGLRVLDLSRGLAGPLATMILADFGADVVRVEAPGATVDEQPAYLFLNRGKRSITIDLANDHDRAELRRIAAGFDVVVEALDPGVATGAGIDYESLSAENPALVYCSITGFGPTGPFANVHADDGLVMAKAGVFRSQPGWFKEDGKPVFRASRDASYFAAMVAIQGIVGALLARDLTGRGQLVETNLLQTLSVRQNPTVRWLLREGEVLPSEAAKAADMQSEKNVLPHHMDPRDLNLIGMRVETKDGRWLVHSLTEPHFFPAWVEVIGLDWIWQDERFKGAPWNLPDAATKGELIHIVQQRMMERTAAEWMDAYLANGNVCGDTIQTTQESLHHPQMVGAGFVVEIEDPRVGPIVQVGPLAKISAAPPEVRGPAPEPGQHTAEVLAEPVRSIGLPAATRTDLEGGPLDGITIVEGAYYYATPFATSLLTDLGARVIKLEPLRGDPYRSLGYGTSSDPVLNLGHNNMVRAMQGKESLAVDLKDERGQEILRRLIAKTDMFVHSFRGKAVKSLHLTEEELREHNPDLIYQYGASYGSVGPYSRQPAIDPVIAAFAGSTAYQAGAGNPPLTETGADPVAAAGHAAAMALGLYAGHRLGHGISVESTMILSNIYLNCEDAFAYDGREGRPDVDSRQMGIGATYRLYETAPPDPDAPPLASYMNPDSRWVFLSAVDDDHFERFCGVAGRSGLASDARYSTRAARVENRTALETELEQVFLTRSAVAWERDLLEVGVGCIGADTMSYFAFIFEDEQSKAIGTMATAAHPSFGGTYWRHAPLVHLSDTPGRGKAFSELGEHTRAILEELGFDEVEIAALAVDKVVSWPGSEG